MSFITKNICSFKKVKTIIVFGKDKKIFAETMWQVLRPHFKVKKMSEALPSSFALINNEIFIIETECASMDFIDKILDFVNFSEQSVLVDASGTGGLESIIKIAQSIKPENFLISNYDDENLRKTWLGVKLKKYTFGFEQGADFRASDLKENGGTNYKINFQGKTVPVWQENFPGKEYIYASLCASSVATILGMNFVEISEALKDCKA